MGKKVNSVGELTQYRMFFERPQFVKVKVFLILVTTNSNVVRHLLFVVCALLFKIVAEFRIIM